MYFDRIVLDIEGSRIVCRVVQGVEYCFLRCESVSGCSKMVKNWKYSSEAGIVVLTAGPCIDWMRSWSVRDILPADEVGIEWFWWFMRVGERVWYILESLIRSR